MVSEESCTQENKIKWWLTKHVGVTWIKRKSLKLKQKLCAILCHPPALIQIAAKSILSILTSVDLPMISELWERMQALFPFYRIETKAKYRSS